MPRLQTPAPRPGLLRALRPARGASRRTAKLLASADRLVADGDVVAAIDLLAAANRERRDPEIEIRIVDLRLLAAERPQPPGRVVWPPTYDDPFPDKVPGRFPEVGTSDVSAAVVGGGVAHHGAVIVRGVFDDEQVARVIEAIDTAEERREAGTVADGADAWYRPVEGLPPLYVRQREVVGDQGGTWLADSPTSTALVLDTLADVGLIDVLAEHFGERPVISVQKSTLRRSPPVHNFAGWHQDGSFLGGSVRTMNVWIALSACGGDIPTPALEIVPRRVPEILPTDGGLGSASISDETVLAHADGLALVHPEFAPGDALIFDQNLVHRTHLTPDMTHARYALESWFFAGSHPAEDYVPLLV